jgi:hypothetical protein
MAVLVLGILYWNVSCQTAALAASTAQCSATVNQAVADAAGDAVETR